MSLPTSLKMPDGRKYIKATSSPLWQIKLTAFKGDERDIPAIVNLLDQSMKITREWQFYIRAINYAMPVRKVSALLNHQRAFTNFNGFERPGDPRANFLLGESLNEELPKFDKVRTCILNTHRGEIQTGNLWLEYMDGEEPPRMKPGKRQPETVEDAENAIDDYVFNPRDHRWMFFAASNISADGTVFPFDNGGFYPWFGGGKRMVTWLPLVSRYPIRIALNYVELVTDMPSPYLS